MRFSKPLRRTVMAKRQRDPETEARWRELERRTEERIAWGERQRREELERAERRQRLLRKFSFGLLGR